MNVYDCNLIQGDSVKSKYLLACSLSFGLSQTAFALPPIDLDMDNWWDALCSETLFYSSYLFECTTPATAWVGFNDIGFGTGINNKLDWYCCSLPSRTFTIPPETIFKYTVDDWDCPGRKVTIRVPLRHGGTLAERTITLPAAPACGCHAARISISGTVQTRYFQPPQCYVGPGLPLETPPPIRRRWYKPGAPATIDMISQPARCQGCPTTHVLPSGATVNTQPPYDPIAWPSGLSNDQVTPPTPWIRTPVSFPPSPATTTVPGSTQNGVNTLHSLDIDLTGTLEHAKISTPLDLTLFELRLCVFQMRRALLDNPDAAPNKSYVNITLKPDVEMHGNLAELMASMRKSAVRLIESSSYGDFNGDGQRNIADYYLISDALYDPPTPENQRTFDMDGNGVFNPDDLILWNSL